MKTRLEAATNIVTIATCLGIMFVGVELFISRGSANGSTPVATYQVGEKVSGLPEARFETTSKTLLLAVRKDCHFCEESVPFYKSLATKLSASGTVKLTIITNDSPQVASDFLKSNDIDIENVISLSSSRMASLRIPGTPTLILTNRDGTVEAVWVGRLDQSGELDVLKRLS